MALKCDPFSLRSLGWGWGFAFGCMAFTGCSVGGDLGKTTVAAAGASAQGGGGNGGNGGNGGTDSDFTPGAGGSPEEVCATRCSADLKNLIDCQDNVLEACGVDEACLGETCSKDPCGAAEALQSSVGCDFWALRTDVADLVRPSCFAVYVANTWDAPTQVDLFYDGEKIEHTGFVQIPSGQGDNLTYTDYDENAGLAPGEVAIIFVSHNADSSLAPCPSEPADPTNAWIEGTGTGKALNVRTDRPVAAYSMVPFGGAAAVATSATLLLPTHAWGTNYIGINAYPASAITPGQPSLNIVAPSDDTNVTILPKVAIAAGDGVAGTPANTPVTFTLNAGEYLQLTQTQELTGSPIQSNKPIGVWGGSTILNVPVDKYAGDSAHQQIPPVSALGSKYVAVRYRNRASAPGEETPPWRLVGAVDGTVLSWTPSVPSGAPTTLDLGEVVEFSASGPFVIESQDEAHPFYAAQYMTSLSEIASASREGDADWVNIVPADQFLDRYIFFTDPTYAETSLVVVRARDGKGNFREVELDCAGALTGWKPIGDYEYTRIDLVTGNFDDVGSCSNGPQEIKSKGPIGVTVWGWGSDLSTPKTGAVSYAYPAGASIRSINGVEVPPVPK